MSVNPFDRLADRYDAWFEAPYGRTIFLAEVGCLRPLIEGTRGHWLEVGVGSGRFAEALGITEGVDPSGPMLERAVSRGIRGTLGRGEELPYSDSRFCGVLLVVTLCFLDDPKRTLRECARVLRSDGYLVVGLVPADSPWGQFYARKARDGHSFYSAARFYTCHQVIAVAARAGFTVDRAGSTLFTPPEVVPEWPAVSREGRVPGAGFVAVRFRRC